MAKGVYEAANMIFGELEDVHYLCLEKDMDIESFKLKLNGLMDNIQNSNEIIVFADLKGGSPYTAALTLLSERGLLSKSKVISGLNLPMLLSILFIEGEVLQEDVESIIFSAKEGITQFELEIDDDESL
jgi:mannose/fructose-specific phosphotransferase system component IIA